MSREKKRRRCRFLATEKLYKCEKIEEVDSVTIMLDEFEAIRLCDYEGRSQIEASDIMGVSRGTIQRLLNSGRKKFVEAVLYDRDFKVKNSYI